MIGIGLGIWPLNQGKPTGALALLANESQGLSIAATAKAVQLAIKDTTTPANNRSNIDINDVTSPVVQSGTSPKLTLQANGLYAWTVHNSLLQAENVASATWSKTRITATIAGGLSPTGKTASLLTEDATATSTHFAQQSAIATIVGATFTYSYEVKPNGRTWLYAAVNDSIDKGNYVNVSTGAIGSAIGSGATVTATSISGGWFRITITWTAVASSASLYGVVLASADGGVTYSGDGVSGMYFTGGQLNRGTVPTAYHVTTSAAWYAVPTQFDASSGLWGLLTEPAATNLAIQAQAFDAAAWSAFGLAASPNTTVAPDGTTTADTITSDGTTGAHVLLQGFTTVSGTTYTNSVFIRPGTSSFVNLTWRSNGTANNYVAAVFDLSSNPTGASQIALGSSSGTLVGTSATSLASGWWRLTLSSSINVTDGTVLIGFAPAATGNTFGTFGFVSFAGSATSTFIAWQAQLETGSVADSPVPTYAATVTRSADQNNEATSTFPWSATAGTLIVSGIVPTDAATRVLLEVDDGTANNRFRIERNSDGHIHCVVTTGGVGQLNLDLGAVSGGASVKVAFAWAVNDFAASLNGAAVVTSGSGSLPTVTSLKIGYSPSGEQWNSREKTIVQLPRRMTNADLVTKAAA